MPLRENDGQRTMREPSSTYEIQAGTMTLEVREKAKLWVFPYTHLLYSCLTPSQNLEISFASHQVIVVGTNLNVLHQALVSFALKMIEPTDKPVHSIEREGVRIQEIEIFARFQGEDV